jgi:hypothetical protein
MASVSDRRQRAAREPLYDINGEDLKPGRSVLL